MSEERAEYKTDYKGPTEFRPETLLPFNDPLWREPTTGEIRLALKRGDLTGSQAGGLLGVNGRTIRKWTGGEQAMPYSAWRLLLIYIGEVSDAGESLVANRDSSLKQAGLNTE